MYQRGKIQEESITYEKLKDSGELPIIGVNTFLGPGGSPTSDPPGRGSGTRASERSS